MFLEQQEDSGEENQHLKFPQIKTTPALAFDYLGHMNFCCISQPMLLMGLCDGDGVIRVLESVLGC